MNFAKLFINKHLKSVWVICVRQGVNGDKL